MWFLRSRNAVDKACFENVFSKTCLINGTSVNSYTMDTVSDVKSDPLHAV